MIDRSKQSDSEFRMTEVEEIVSNGRRMPIRGIIVGLFIVVVVLTCMGFSIPLETMWCLATGWVTYPLTIAGDIKVEWNSVIVALVAALLFTGGLHLILTRWRPWALRKTLGVSLAILSAFIAGTSMIGIVHQITWLMTSKEPVLYDARKGYANSVSINNLKQIGLAIHNYHDKYEWLPAGALLDSSGRSLHGWMTTILPYLDQKPLSDQLNLSVPWDAPANTEATATYVDQYSNPRLLRLLPDPPWDATTHYAGNVRVLLPGQSLAICEITDGLAHTLLVGEVGAGFKTWADPSNLRDPALGLRVSATTFGFSETDPTFFLHGDGSVHEYQPDTDPAILKALATSDGGEEITYDD